MKKAKKIIHFLFVISVIVFSVTFVSFIGFYKYTTHGISLDNDKLQILSPNKLLKIYDKDLNEIKPSSASYIKLSKLSLNTKNSFLSAEDKRFYKHKGLDYIRIGGAILSNLKNMSFSEGASTISQQLVKNTQLSNEKTIQRKLKEFKITKELENQYTKDEILELYLNNIYFGNGCYGIENASKHYFNKSASNLSLAESALLAGTINAPSVYDIESNTEKAIERRNLILSLMKNNGKITEAQFNEAISETPNICLTEINGNSSLYSSIIQEATNLINKSEHELVNSNFKIYTSIDKNLCDTARQSSNKYNLDAEKATIIIDNKTHDIIAVNGKTKILNSLWQPGSLIKPILVYAPAIEKGIISPATKILDNKINISGYSPENADKKYHGYISAKTALSKSYNIPAVKILNELTIVKAKKFAEKLGIKFEESDNHLALALGGFEKGVSPKSLCDAYSVFSNNGKFQESTFINKITKNDKVIFAKENNEKQVMQESTAFLINDMLSECAKTGTAQKLNGLDFKLCSKTGTVGKSNSSNNSLAYNVAYTADHTILTLIQASDMPSSINGSTYPTFINKEILSNLYKNKKPTNFKTPKTVTLISLDENEYNNNKLKLTKSDSKYKEYFLSSNIPKMEENYFKLEAINTPHSKPILCFTINKNYDYFLIRKQNSEEKILFSSSENSPNFIKFCDKTAQNGKIYTYFLKICEKNKNEELFSNAIKLKVY